MKRQKIIGAKVRLKIEQRNRGGAVFPKGSVMTIYGSFRGYSLEDEKGCQITRVSPKDVEFIN